MLAELLVLDILPQDTGPAPSDEFADFIAAFPAFAAISESAFDFWHAQALLITEPMEACLGARFQIATWLLTAHYLTLQGLGTGAEASVAAQGMSGFKSVRSGQLSLERGESSSSSAGEYGSTSYGQRVWPMLRVCVTGPRVTATGTLPCGGGYRSGPFPWQ